MVACKAVNHRFELNSIRVDRERRREGCAVESGVESLDEKLQYRYM